MKYIYLNDSGENPYVKDNYLFIPFEMLNEKYQKNFRKITKLKITKQRLNVMKIRL